MIKFKVKKTATGFHPLSGKYTVGKTIKVGKAKLTPPAFSGLSCT